MTLRLHNTLTRQKEEFRPLDPKNVRMYVCGPTVYDRIHIGNARPFVIFDVLFRLLRHQYGADHVKYARNITDVDDKINNRAKERGVDIGTLTADTTRLFREDVAELGCLAPTVEPTATGHIEEMKAMIATLIAKGYAYAADGHVLFNVPAMIERPPLPGHIYGLLSKKNRDDFIAGARVEVAPYKRDPADFVLWKPSTPDLPGWESPWGRGRPGWHIECSAMARKHLGESFDIHGGGLDLIFPHHENEIAQSECCTEKPFVKYWMHNGFIERGGEKMAKSVGNIDKVRDLLDEFPGEAVRLMLLKTHYRSPMEFTKEGLKESKNELDGFYRAIEKISLGNPDSVRPEIPVDDELMQCLYDDLNTPAYLSRLHRLRSELMRVFLEPKAVEYRPLLNQLIGAGALIGLLQSNPDTWFRGVKGHVDVTVETEAASTGDGFNVISLEELERIKKAIELRNAARRAKNFKEADRIRDELVEEGIVLEDGPTGTTWRKSGVFSR